MVSDIISRLLWASNKNEQQQKHVRDKIEKIEQEKDNRGFFISSMFTGSREGRVTNDGQSDKTQTAGDDTIWNVKTVFAAVVASGSVLMFSRFYRRHLKRILTAAHLNPSIDLVHTDLNTGKLIPGRLLYGKVVSVGDGDNFRVYHTPGGIWAGWGWLRHVPNIPGSGLTRQKLQRAALSAQKSANKSTTNTFTKNNDAGRHVLWKAARKVFGLQSSNKKKGGGAGGPKSKKLRLTDCTVHVRLCGIDAPEMAHFGQPGQPYGQEALNWLTGYLLGSNVWVRLFALDQYGRVVGHVRVWKWNGFRDVGAEMLRRGLAVVYEAKSGAEFADREPYYRKLEAKAHKKHLGLWAQRGHIETPGEYKRQNQNN